MGEPCAVGARVAATVDATRELWGDAGVEGAMATLDAADRALFTSRPPPRWVPERTYVAWMVALWEGPCARDHAKLALWVDRLTDRGFGTARRMIMSLASPWIILRRANALWHGEHTHGELTVTALDASSARFELRAHPFVESEVAREAVSESFRYIVHRCRTRWATERHEIAPDGALHVTVAWG